MATFHSKLVVVLTEQSHWLYHIWKSTLWSNIPLHHEWKLSIHRPKLPDQTPPAADPAPTPALIFAATYRGGREKTPHPNGRKSHIPPRTWGGRQRKWRRSYGREQHEACPGRRAGRGRRGRGPGSGGRSGWRPRRELGAGEGRRGRNQRRWRSAEGVSSRD